ncbi:MAG: GGDEF domain-containing protein, partial [Eubacterium sp.]
GHQGGDEVLQDLANEMSALFSTDDILGRLGGDEFLAFVKDIKGQKETVIKRIQELCAIMNRCYFRNGRRIEVSISVGIRETDSGCTFENLYFEADQALYYIKQHGRNSFKEYDEMVEKEMGKNNIKKSKGAY